MRTCGSREPQPTQATLRNSVLTSDGRYRTLVTAARPPANAPMFAKVFAEVNLGQSPCSTVAHHHSWSCHFGVTGGRGSHSGGADDSANGLLLYQVQPLVTDEKEDRYFLNVAPLHMFCSLRCSKVLLRWHVSHAAQLWTLACSILCCVKPFLQYVACCGIPFGTMSRQIGMFWSHKSPPKGGSIRERYHNVRPNRLPYCTHGD